VAKITHWWTDADLWVTPTVAVFPPRIGEWRDLAPEQAFRSAARLGAFTALFNLTGQPAASLPLGVSRGGLPIGVQLVGRPGEDETVLEVSRRIEEALPWRERRAPACDARVH
jgi:amidase